MPLSQADFDFVRDLVCSRSAIALTVEKGYLAEARLAPLARAEGFASIDELLDKLRADPRGGLPQKVVEAMATNETSFFRDLHPFEALRRDILPELIRRRSAERRLNIWCAACSSGQEPYSLAMLIREHFAGLPGWTVAIRATDFSSEMVRKAREGRYNQAEINRGLPARLLIKYFTQEGADWQLSADIRRMVEFRTMNLIEAWPTLPAQDIIMMRNVLIYFEPAVKKAILGKLARVLHPQGYQFLGGSETPLGLDDRFERTAHERASCYRLRTPGP